MATRLKSIVRFINVAPAASVSQPHGLAWSPPGGGDIAQVPDQLTPSTTGFTVVGDATNVTVTNNTPNPLSIDVLAELWHTVEREFGNAATLELVPRPFVENQGGGGGGGGAGREFLPEQWAQNDVPAAQAATPMPCSVSQLFDTFMAIRPGFLVGIGLRFNAALVAGDATATVTVNGVATGLFVTVTAPLDKGQTIQAVGLDAFAAGDVIGVTLQTAAGFLPSGSLDGEASVEIDTD